MDSISKTKVCTKCKIEKPYSSYYPSSKGVNKFRPQCKACESARAKIYYQNNLEKMADYREKVKVKKAEWSKEYAKTESAKKSREKTRAKNREKRNAYNKKWREKNKEKAAQHWRNRRAKKLQVKSDNYSVEDLINKWGSLCHLCNKQINLEAPRKPRWLNDISFYYGLQIDHVIPLSKGGDDTIQNVRPAHAICNLRKGKS